MEEEGEKDRMVEREDHIKKNFVIFQIMLMVGMVEMEGMVVLVENQVNIFTKIKNMKMV